VNEPQTAGTEVLIVGDSALAASIEHALSAEGLVCHGSSTPIGAKEIMQSRPVFAMVVVLPSLDLAAERTVSALRGGAGSLPIVLVGPSDDPWALSEIARRQGCAGHVTQEHVASQLFYALRDARQSAHRRPRRDSKSIERSEIDAIDAAVDANSQYFAARMRLQIRYFDALPEKLQTVRQLIERVMGGSDHTAHQALLAQIAEMRADATVLQLAAVVGLLTVMSDALEAQRNGLAPGIADALEDALQMFAECRTDPESPLLERAARRIAAARSAQAEPGTR